jgi:hypothetical protein
MGIAPPGAAAAREKLDSIDSADLESIPKVETFPVEPTAGALVKALTSEAEESPKPADADAPGTHLKTKLLGTPAVVPEIKPPPGFAADEEIEEAPISLELEDDTDEEEDEAADADEARASDESAVAWLGPPPGVALDEAPETGEAKARKSRMVKIVGGVVAGAAAVLLIALAFGGKKDDVEGEQKPAASAPAEAPPTEPAKVEEANTAKPETTAEAPKEEPAKEEETAAKEETSDPKTEETPKATEPVARPTTRWRPRTTTTTKSTTKTTTSKTTTKKTKPSFTPSGI